MVGTPLTRAERASICLKLARSNYDKAEKAWLDATKSNQREWVEYWDRYSWMYLLNWAALKEGCL